MTTVTHPGTAPGVNPSGEKVLIYHLRDVVKTREAEGSAFRLRVPSLQIALGEKIALIGESGCGKSTLLDMLSMTLKPSEIGSFRFRPEPGANTVDISALWQKRHLNLLGDLRRLRIGYVMQTGGLLPYLTVRENINLSRRLLDMQDDGLVDELANDLGIRRHLDKLPHMLSVGERQRVAIGRALAHRPAIVIADEPTASLDPIAAERIMSLFIELVDELHITVILASHAWRHINRLGLRHLEHHTHREADGSLTETVVSG
ncbi:MAG: ABC transporter ATP-binding protein [gamma proteobacterium symbiont of Ctena orbiculata]|nr:ABC transporter ATP-binding protein [Candidatus Thiodiazotropha taylori]MBT3057285.1 ABC transporter ATP-binding protein [Candidatus Thiodiazotropha sp. (ex Lucina pensylvanica)]MBT3061173.1 ABC transporter ATP-binding protein [Candidatus Thiodiazotropha sp. (ex Lucina pensylvanica)]MBV2094072.1 ABC transporter ATP-binding protein [Candidatus Thiodiazotropha sp. (ex Codakia orbicularis)]PUB77786.1 MAG: ABC transporter ATP-binding protein [gamma proteobacterium symbiont of Ctena orbiculata]